jgi:hypothetical protein
MGDAYNIDDRVTNCEDRLDRVEQYLPLLATKADLEAAIEPLATREEMYAAIKAEGERSRLHATVLFEDTRDDIRIVLEHLVALSNRVDELARR